MTLIHSTVDPHYSSRAHQHIPGTIQPSSNCLSLSPPVPEATWYGHIGHCEFSFLSPSPDITDIWSKFQQVPSILSSKDQHLAIPPMVKLGRLSDGRRTFQCCLWANAKGGKAKIILQLTDMDSFSNHKNDKIDLGWRAIPPPEIVSTVSPVPPQATTETGWAT